MKKGIDNITKPVYDLLKKEIPGIVNQAIQADKDILSKIEMKYVEDNNITNIIFPKGVMPLSISINTHQLFLLGIKLVDDNGQEVEGYEIDDYYIYDDGILSISIVGDISEQVINGLAYISINGEIGTLLNDTYHLFYPVTSGGTKLYKHHVECTCNSSLDSVSVLKVSMYFITSFADEINSDNISSLPLNSKIISYMISSLQSQTTPYPVSKRFLPYEFKSTGGTAIAVSGIFLVDWSSNYEKGSIFEIQYLDTTNITDTVTEL